MTTTSETLPALEESIEIDAPPARVWSLVTDLSRMSDRSPQVVRTVVQGGPVRLGTRTFNVNRRGLLFWPTRAKVVRFEPHSDFAFRIKDNFVIWSFALEPTANGGTRVTHRRETPDGISGVSQFLTRIALGGQQSFGVELHDGMRRTLAALKADAEA